LNQKFTHDDRLSKEIRQVIYTGSRFRIKNVVMYIKESSRPRITVIAGKRTGKSNKRNKLKRRTREIFRKQKCKLANYNMVIIYKKGSSEYNYGTIKEILNKLWTEAQVVK